ncbi:fumarylacetoacetate hydrolase family protein [Methanomethylovorans sp.]|uniref:fumarylacetoacetate hydrolase family protein n=1 Tax=Methanomethylovorans sp. TaxID=2758717 RepID=UPI000A9511B8|nr:fumarylacetoacetate hydrolase family protein [Methanomethylovorans sp.]
MLGRFRYRDETFYGNVDGNKVIGKGDVEGKAFELSELNVLPPTVPTKIICVGLNYLDHAIEMDMPVPKEPILFLKPPSAVIGHTDKIIYPRVSELVDFEAELAVIIGKRCKNIKISNASDVIAGYTCFNDVTARDLQRRDGQWTRAKSFDTFAPVGPFIVPAADIDPENIYIRSRVNGETKQDSSTSNLIFEIPYLLEFISKIMTLEVGDIIATGTPPGVSSLHPGDVVEIDIEGIGILKNEVV